MTPDMPTAEHAAAHRPPPPNHRARTVSLRIPARPARRRPRHGPRAGPRRPRPAPAPRRPGTRGPWPVPRAGRARRPYVAARLRPFERPGHRRGGRRRPALQPGAPHDGTRVGEDRDGTGILDRALPAEPVSDTALDEVAEHPGELGSALEGRPHRGVRFDEGVQQMRRVDLPVAVAQRTSAGARHDGGQLHGESGVELGAVRYGLLGNPRRPVLHISHPISPAARIHPRMGPSRHPTQVGHTRTVSPPCG